MFNIITVYVYKTWTLALSKGHRVKIFDNIELRRLYGPKREEGTSRADKTA
jgi:hypothetical protein